MGSLLNKINPYTFDDLQGNIPLREEVLKLFVRGGVDGTGAIKTGLRSKKVTIKTVHYVADVAAAKTALTAYKTLVGANPVAITQHDELYGNYLIISVDQVIAEAHGSVVGSIVSNPTVLQICQWTIIG